MKVTLGLTGTLDHIDCIDTVSGRYAPACAILDAGPKSMHMDTDHICSIFRLRGSSCESAKDNGLILNSLRYFHRQSRMRTL